MFAACLVLLCAGCVNESAIMMKEVVQEIGRHANMMPRERGITLPMVNVENRAVIVRRLIYFTRVVPGGGTAITTPQFVAEYDLTNSKFIRLKRFDLELPDLQGPPWIHSRPVFEDAKDIIPEFNRIWDLYDMLIRAYLHGDTGDDNRLQEAATQYLRYFRRHAEVPLLPYYRYYGGDFLGWVERMARIEQ
jgi:hypothetical protein